MKATSIEFRFRMVINATIIIIGFWAPWIETLGIGPRIPLLEWLALELSRTGLVSFAVATPLVIITATLFAAGGAILRVWGTAWLGPATVLNGEMQAGAIMADGPYRYVRNPLYLGFLSMAAAIAFMMPPTGSLFAMVALAIFQMRLIFAEEAFLTQRLGEQYLAYLRAVPRLFPRIRTALARTGRRPSWLRAVIAEPIPIGVFLALAVFSWSYNNQLMIRIILVSLGVSLLVRALMPATKL